VIAVTNQYQFVYPGVNTQTRTNCFCFKWIRYTHIVRVIFPHLNLSLPGYAIFLGKGTIEFLECDMESGLLECGFFDLA
jgi:hypothetical protein